MTDSCSSLEGRMFLWELDGWQNLHPCYFSNLEEGSCYLLNIFINVKMKTAIVYAKLRLFPTMAITFYIIGFLCVCCA